MSDSTSARPRAAPSAMASAMYDSTSARPAPSATGSSSAAADDKAPGAEASGGRCFACGQSCALKWCSQCHTVAYCGPVCQRADWAAHKATCRTFTDFAEFTQRTLEEQKEPMLGGPFAGCTPKQLYETMGASALRLPIFSQRQFSLRSYYAMMNCINPERAASLGLRHSGDLWVDFVREALRLAARRPGAKPQLCSEPNCRKCLIIYRQTPDARTCQACQKPVGRAADRCGQACGTFLRRQFDEQGVHLFELEFCSVACRRRAVGALTSGARAMPREEWDSRFQLPE